MPEKLRVEVSPDKEVTARVFPAANRDQIGITVILGHGAGADQRSDFMTRFATGLAARGVNVVTFNFLYTEQGRRVPDANKALEACADVPDVDGVVFFGYPLHPPGKVHQLRAKHLSDIIVPTLFVQGSRDAFGTPDELRPIMKELKAPADLFVVEDGDHSFKVLKRAGITQEDAYKAVLDRIELWLRQTFAN